MNRLPFLLLAALPVCGAENAALSGLAQGGPSLTVSFIRMLGALALVVALFFGAAWLFRNGLRFQPAGLAQRKLQILESRALGPRQAVHVIGYENQRLLVGASPNGITLLSALPDRPETGEKDQNPRIVPVSFGEALMQALGRKS